MSRQVSRGSVGDYQADEKPGVARLSWLHSSRRVGRCRVAQLAIIKQMIRLVLRGLYGDNQAAEPSDTCLLICLIIHS